MAAQLFYWTPQLVSSVAEKQWAAVCAAAKSDRNIYELSIEDVRIVCESQVPWEYQGQVSFQSAEHQQYWEKMNSMSLQDLTNQFEEDIQNRRILGEILG